MTSVTPLRYAAMQARAERTAGRRPARGERAQVRLWLPLTPLFVLLAPFALLLALLAFLPARLAGVNAFEVALRLGALLMALSGTHVEVEAVDASVRIKII